MAAVAEGEDEDEGAERPIEGAAAAAEEGEGGDGFVCGDTSISAGTECWPYPTTEGGERVANVPLLSAVGGMPVPVVGCDWC